LTDDDPEATTPSRQHDDEVQLYAFDCMALDGDDLRKIPLAMRKTNLARLLARRPDGIFVSDFEQGEIGPELFRIRCREGLGVADSRFLARLFLCLFRQFGLTTIGFGQSGRTLRCLNVGNRLRH
jgi:hypothetical protein